MTHEAHHATSLTEEDDVAIRETVAEAERYQNDVTPFIALHTPDAIIVNVAGRRVRGRETLREAMEHALASPLAKVITKTEIEDIVFVAPDVAIVSCLKHISDERDDASRNGAGASLPNAGSLTYVVVKRDGGWRIAAAQTTPIQTS